jgi:hypothetical protein
MKKFALACEDSKTGKVVIKNILRGYFAIQNSQQDIAELSPPEGGWRPLLTYLTCERFREDVENHQFIILQIDTDVSHDFDIPHTDNLGNQLTTLELIEKVIEKLIFQMNSGQIDFYQDYAKKIIFAICVHSIECWLVAHYGKSENLLNCLTELKTFKFPNNLQVAKKVRNYDLISQPFLIRQHIETVAQKDKSFKHFIQQLQLISP